MGNKILNKKGNISIYLVVTAIIVAAIITMGIAFSDATKGSVEKDISVTNSGFEHYVENTSKVPVDDAGK